MTDLQSGLTAVTQSQGAYLKAGSFIEGTNSELFFSTGMQRQLNKSKNAEVRINLSRVVVSAVADRLEISALSCADERAQSTLDEISAANQFDLMLPDLFRMALEYGDAYLILDGDAEEGVTLYPNSPLTARVFYSPENPRVKSYAIKRWSVPNPTGKGELVRVNLYYADRIERFITKTTGDGVKANEFVPYVGANEDEGSESVIPNPYGFVPVYHFRTARPYGKPEHRDGYGPQDAINKLAITHLASIDYLGFPQRYVMAAQGQDATAFDDFDADAFHDAETPEAVQVGPHAGQGQSGRDGLNADPGGVWSLPAGSNAGQFEAASSDNFINSLNEYTALLAQTTNTPLHFLNTTNDAPSGESLRVAEAPLVKKVRNRALSFAGALQDALEDALSLYGFDVQVAVHWASAESNNSADVWAVVAAKQAAGVPTYDAMLSAGMTPDQLEAMGLSRETPMSDADKVQRIKDVAQAVYGLNAAVENGTASPSQVRYLMGDLLPEADEEADAASIADVETDKKISRLKELATVAQGFGVAVTAGVLDQATVQAILLSVLGEANEEAA